MYPHKKFHIGLVPGARPKHSQPYAIPRIHLAAFKKELDCLVQTRVLSPQGASKWGSPTFVTPKKRQHCSLGQQPMRIKQISVT
jgi:hypothetical protein